MIATTRHFYDFPIRTMLLIPFRKSSFTVSGGRIHMCMCNSSQAKFTSRDDQVLRRQSCENFQRNKMKNDRIEETDSLFAMKPITWNKNLLRCVGIWPLKVYDPLFFFFFIYLTLHCTLTMANLINFPKDTEIVVTNLSENVILVMTLIKIVICRIQRSSIARLLTEVQENNINNNSFSTTEERLIFKKYTNLTRQYFVIAAISMSMATGLYYVMNMLPNVQILLAQNTSLNYRLPYQTRAVINIDDTRVYICYCIYQMLIGPSITFGYVGFDCLFTNLALHITAQFGILSCKVKETLSDSESFQYGMWKLVFRHYQLISLAERLEKDFNIVILQQLMGTTFHLCISGYHALTGSINGQGIKLVIFFLYGFCVMSTLFFYCYIGECLIQESTKLGNAFYHYEWYNVSPINMKLVHICMLRTRKPQQLTSGKFCVLSLTTFTDILKASMGYLSVLRSFM